ncbi:MAG: pur operon repressor [Clostridia bacterium]|nr:pur operon repressor [Clostridia bacterium]
MERIKRNERLAAMTRILTSTPNRLYTLSEFTEMFGSAKSTISEDLSILAAALRQFDLGRLTTVAGAAGGVVYRAIPSREKVISALNDLCRRLEKPGRVLPGDFLYTNDITCDADLCEVMGQILASRYYDRAPDFVLTMETKGIPVAMMTARALDVPLVIARRDSKAYEGSAVKINYISGDGSDRIETMALARRAVTPGQKALIIDDFMKGGGTLKGMHDLMKEFDVSVVGTGVVIAKAEPQKKRVDGVTSLLILEGVDRETGAARVVPSDWIYTM